MAAGNTYVAIATSTLASATASVTFSSIPSTYTDLVLVLQPASTTFADNIGLNFNSDTGNNYSSTNLSGNGAGAAASSGRTSNAPYINVTNIIGTTGTLGAMTSTIHIMNYASTTIYKAVISRTGQLGATYNGNEIIAGLWRNTAAINTIVVKQSGSPNFITGSTFTLYGIAAA
jgi:hypothetical protein